MIERKILITHTKVNKRAYWLVKNMPPSYLNLNLICETRNLQVFFGFIFASRWIRTQEVNADRKIGQFFAGFFPYFKEKENCTALHCYLLTSLACSIRL